jgi:hypothetical protein
VFCDDGIVDDTAMGVEEDGEGRGVGLESEEGRWSEPFEELGCGRAEEAVGGVARALTLARIEWGREGLTWIEPCARHRTIQQTVGRDDDWQL